MSERYRKIKTEELLLWVCKYHYSESDRGIGSCVADICTRGNEDNLRYTFGKLSRKEKKDIMCRLIEKVGYPCEDYADDFDDEESGFGFSCEWDEEKMSIHFDATFRV